MKHLISHRKYLLIFLLSVFFITTTSLFAVPANPKAVEVVQPDGKKVKIKNRGDEHFSWQEDEKGYVVKKDKADGFWKYAVPKKNEAAFDVLPNDKVGETNPQAKGLKKGDLPDKKLILEKVNKRKTKVAIAPANAPAQNPNAPASKVLAAPVGGSTLSLPAPPMQKVPVSGQVTVKNIVILACFADQWSGGTVNPAYGRPQAEYNDLFNQAGHITDGAVGSVRDYYSEASYGNVTIQTIVTPWVMLPSNQAYYGGNDVYGNDQNPQAMIQDAINAADAAGFDFSQGDGDGDGWVDCLTVIHSGYGEEWGGQDDCIWSHKWELASTATKDTVKMYTYHTEPACRGYESDQFGEITRIGVICHELGHFFGLPDLYDYSSTFGGLGDWCLMSGGSWNGSDGNCPPHFSAWCKNSLGFVNPKLIHSDTSIPIGRLYDNPDVHLLRDGCSNGEYFLIENRQQEGFDTALPGSGIIIYHVDSKSANNDLGEWLHPLVKIEEADGNDSIGSSSICQASDAWTNLSGDFKDQAGVDSSNSMLYQGTVDYLRADNATYYTYNTLSNFSASGTTMTYDLVSLVPTVHDQTVATSDYIVSWTPSLGATKYEIQEGTAYQTSFTDGAENEDAMWENWSIGGQVQRTDVDSRTGTNSYYFTSYDGDKWYSSVSSLAMRESITLTSNINLFFYFKSNSAANSGYLKLQASSDNGDTWETLWTHNGGLISSWQAISKSYASFSALGFSLGDTIKLRFIMNVESSSDETAFPANGWAIDDISVTNTQYSGFVGNTLSNNVGVVATWDIFGKANGSYQYRVRAYANGVWQKWSPPATITVDLPAPKITVKGNTVLIANGDSTPSLTDHTDFGNAEVGVSTVTRTFTISNIGALALDLTGTPKVSITGTNASEFQVIADPSTPIASAGSTTFQVKFTPGASGFRTATVSIASNDTTKNPFTFSIKGNGNDPGVLDFSTNSTNPVDEFSGSKTIYVNRTGGKDGIASVDVTITDGTATHGDDYYIVEVINNTPHNVIYDTINNKYSLNLSWADQDAAYKYFNVKVNTVDTTVEGDETVNFILSNATGASLGTLSSFELTIRDNDYSLTVQSGGNGTVDNTTPVQASGTTTANISASFNANYHFVNWTYIGGPVTFTPNANSADASISYTGNSIVTANFAHDTTTLTMAVAGNGTTTPVSGSSSQLTATAIPITATAGGADFFAGWSVVGNAAVDNAQDPLNANVTLTGNATVTANFISSAPTVVTPGTPETPPPVLAGDAKYFTVTVAPGTKLLEITTTGNGDCDIYLRHDAAPSLSVYEKRSTNEGANEKIRVFDPTPGIWYVLLYAFANYDSVTLDISLADPVLGKPVLTADTTVADKVILTWTDAVGGADAYEIFRSEFDDIEMATKLAEVESSDPWTYTDQFSAGTANYDYYYWVRAVTEDVGGNITDEGDYSVSVPATRSNGIITTLVSGTAKTPISGTAGSIQTFKIVVPAGYKLLEIKLTGGTGDCDFDVTNQTGTIVKRCVMSTNNGLIQINDPAAGDWFIHLYGNTGYAGVTLLAQYLKTAPLAPAGLLASDGTFENAISLTWTASVGATSYEVWRAAATGTLIPTTVAAAKIADTADCAYVDIDVTFDPAKTYFYWLKAKNAVNTSVFSAYNSGYVTRVPASPGSITVSNATTFDKVVVGWPKVIGAGSYRIYRTPNPARAISNASAAANCVITLAGHGLINGNKVLINGTAGTISTLLNGKSHVITVVDADNFSVPVSTLARTYLPGGTATLETITGIVSNVNKSDITSNSHGFATGDTVLISGVAGTMSTPLNGKSFVVTKIDDNSFSVPVKTTGLAYLSGGTAISADLLVTVQSNPVLAAYTYNDSADLADPDPNPSRSYFYWVSALNGNGESALKQGPNTGAVKKAGPATVGATAGTLFGKVRVTWTAVPGATGYDVYRYTDKGCTLNQAIFADIAAPTLLYDDTSALMQTVITPPNNVYYYKVKAKYSTFYTSDFNTTAGSGYHKLMPGPTVTASAGTYFGKVHLSWTAVAGATSYDVYWDTVNTFANAHAAINVPGAIVYDHTAAAANTPYFYRIKAKLDATGCTTNYSTTVTGKHISLTGPATITATAGTLYGKVRVTWAAVTGATSYELFRDGGSVIVIAATKYDDVPGDTISHDYIVKAIFGAYTSNASAIAKGYAYKLPTIASLAAPTLTASKDVYTDKVRLTWTEVPLAENYIIYRNTTNVFTGVQLAKVTGLTYDDLAPAAGTAVPGVLYYYWIKSNNDTIPKTSPQSTTPAQGRVLGITTAVADNVPIANIAGTKDSCAYYSIDVPAGTTRLVAKLTGTTNAILNDCDLYAKFGSLPTTISSNAKGIESATGESLTVTKPAAGTWYFLLYGVSTLGYTNVTLTVNCYSAVDIILTQVPANDQVAPFTAVFKGRVIDQSIPATGIPGMQVKVRNPITGITSVLANTDATGYFAYSTTIGLEGTHTFDFFFTTMPDVAKGTASHTVATKKGCLEVNNFFDSSAFLPAAPVSVTLQADIMGLQNFLDSRNGWDEDAIVPAYEDMWVENTILKTGEDAQLAAKIDSGLYMLFYGVEGAGVGNDKTSTSALSSVPFSVHVAPDKMVAVLANLRTQGIIDATQEAEIIGGKIGIVSVAALSNFDDVADGLDIYLIPGEKLEILAKIAAGTQDAVTDGGKYSGILTKKSKVSIDDGARIINVLSAAFVK
ncbi:MAG: hypothetical protein A2X48_12745 [Lentisphaerae bacterium GWF2_49_21]|nr:MAG: hypothetical protein A2X48_12745 [Lentisphaerae bacterium GWF2_49_21]